VVRTLFYISRHRDAPVYFWTPSRPRSRSRRRRHPRSCGDTPSRLPYPFAPVVGWRPGPPRPVLCHPATMAECQRAAFGAPAFAGPNRRDDFDGRPSGTSAGDRGLSANSIGPCIEQLARPLYWRRHPSVVEIVAVVWVVRQRRPGKCSRLSARRPSAAVAEGRHARNARFAGLPMAPAGSCSENCSRGVLKVQQASTPDFRKLLKIQGKLHRVFTGDPLVRRHWT
jgi:hypothetical protein